MSDIGWVIGTLMVYSFGIGVVGISLILILNHFQNKKDINSEESE